MIRVGLSRNKNKGLHVVNRGCGLCCFFYVDGDAVLVSERDVNCLGVETGEREGNVGGRGLLGC